MLINFEIKPEVLDAHFKTAHAFSHLSRCLKKKVGSTLVEIKNPFGSIDQIVSSKAISLEDCYIVSGGCGSPVTPCKECVRKKLNWSQDGCWSIHSEVRAIFNYFEKYGYTNDLSNCIMFVTHGPCDQCIKYMNYFRIPVCIYDIEYKTDYSKWSGKIQIIQKDQTTGGKLYAELDLS